MIKLKKIQKIAAFLLSAAIISTNFLCIKANADEPYDVYNYDKWGEAVPSQAGYIAEKAVYGADLGISDLNSPNDIFIDSNQNVYIADTKNNRIVVTDAELEKIITIFDKFTLSDGSVTTLSEPMGIFVSNEKNLIYIADTLNSRILVSNMDGNVINEIKKPESPIYNQQTFQPQKVISDNIGNIYAVIGSINSGAVLFNPSGEFLGFFGANRVENNGSSVTSFIKKLFSTEKKKARQSRNSPTEIANFDIDEKGFIFTCTHSDSQSTDIVKKLNYSGNNNFADTNYTFGDIISMYDSTENTNYHTQLIDIDTASDGIFCCLDQTSGKIFQYDEECNLLFIMGTQAAQTGGFSSQGTAIETSGDKIYVLDMMKNSITLFRETEFGKTVHKAIFLYNEGQYEEALEPWQEVLRQDGNYRIAHLGMAAALLKKCDYKGAMKYAKIADSSYYYNKAFEGWRNQFFQENLSFIFLILIIIFTAFICIKRLLKNNIKKRR